METPNLRCCVCEKPLDSVNTFHPIGGTAFHTEGHYGSSVTDHMDGTVTTVCVCDNCMIALLEQGYAHET